MDVEEFLAIFTSLKLIDNYFTERDVVISYNLAMMTQVDEIDSSRHLKMQFLEFIEAVARCSDVISLPPPATTAEEWPWEKRTLQLLHKKLEHMLNALLPLCQKDFANKYRWPNKNEWGLYMVPKNLPASAKLYFNQ